MLNSKHGRSRRDILTALLYVVGLNAGLVGALDQLSIAGSKFYLSSGEQFFVKGVVYSVATSDSDTWYIDTLADATQCALDASVLKQLGANSISVYYIDNGSDHSGCMKAFENAGIYVWVSLSTAQTAVYRTEPTWNKYQFGNFTEVMDEFVAYNNTAGFWIGRESIYDGGASVPDDLSFNIMAPYIKAAARDMRLYRDFQGYRKIPMGYIAYRDLTEPDPGYYLDWQNYLGCGLASETVDFYAMTIASWCGNETFATSGYGNLSTALQDYNLPAFIAETGCAPLASEGSLIRSFLDQDAILGPQLDSILSGSMIYNFLDTDDDDQQGLVAYPTSAGPRLPYPVSTGGFVELRSKWNTLRPTGTLQADYHPELTPPPCPTPGDGIWSVDAKAALPPTAFDTLTSRTTRSVTSTATSTSTASPGLGAPSDPNSNIKRHQLTTYELVGICLAASFGLLTAIVGYLWFCGPLAAWRHKRRIIDQNQYAKPELDGSPIERAALDGGFVGSVASPKRKRAEMEAGIGPFELGEPNPRELDAVR